MWKSLQQLNENLKNWPEPPEGKMSKGSDTARLGSGFFMVPNNLIEDRRISGYSKLIYCILSKHADREGWCWPGILTIAKLSGFSKSTVQRNIDDLKNYGWIEQFDVEENPSIPPVKKKQGYVYKLNITGIRELPVSHSYPTGIRETPPPVSERHPHRYQRATRIIPIE
jgi:hypothetical protein